MSLLLTERLIQRQIHHWNRLREFLPVPTDDDPPPRGPVITVSRLASSGGRTLATTLAERLELEFHDQSLVDRIAEDRDLERELVARLDERTVSRARLWVEGALQGRLFLQDDYHTALVRVVMSIAARGGAVILGRGAELILGERADLRVRVVAADATRRARLGTRLGLDRPAARDRLAGIDQRRAEFMRRVFGVEPGRPQDFDLVLNADRLDSDSMVELVLTALTGAAVVAGRAHPSASP